MMRLKLLTKEFSASSNIKDEIKMKLKSQYDMLNSAELKRKITKLQNKLLKLNALKQEMSKEKDIEKDPFVYIST